jgi:hypothetical protein
MKVWTLWHNFSLEYFTQHDLSSIHLVWIPHGIYLMYLQKYIQKPCSQIYYPKGNY